MDLVDDIRQYREHLAKEGHDTNCVDPYRYTCNYLGALLAEVEKLKEEHVSNCLFHRCHQHRTIPALNVSDRGSECGACVLIGDDRAKELTGQIHDLKAEVEKLKADLSYANYHLKENVEMIKLAKGVVDDNKKLREALEYAARKLRYYGYPTLASELDKALKGGE